MSLTIRRDLTLGHRLKESGLGLGGGPVDLVTDDDVGEDSAGFEDELPLLLVIDADAGDVGGQQVRSELDAVHGAVNGAAERTGKHRLADAGYVLHQEMALGEQHHEGGVDASVLALDDPGHSRADGIRDGHHVVNRRCWGCDVAEGLGMGRMDRLRFFVAQRNPPCVHGSDRSPCYPGLLTVMPLSLSRSSEQGRTTFSDSH